MRCSFPLSPPPTHTHSSSWEVPWLVSLLVFLVGSPLVSLLVFSTPVSCTQLSAPYFLQLARTTARISFLVAVAAGTLQT